MRREDPVSHAFNYYNLNLRIQLFFTATFYRKKETQRQGKVGLSTAVAARSV